jgi:MoaA/NifB/PqqE/SkfB family radical SAM enzyme
MCARNHHGGIENPLLKVSDIDLDLFKKSIPETLIKQLYSITLCGNFGDPLLNKDLIPIIEYIAAANADVRLDIHTNGSLRNTQWWENLAKSLTTNSLVQFGIDGMADTHEIYRVGTSFSKIIENAKAFIDAGGKARWNFITFKHNEHQLEEARALSKEMGFESFRAHTSDF